VLYEPVHYSVIYSVFKITSESLQYTVFSGHSRPLWFEECCSMTSFCSAVSKKKYDCYHCSVPSGRGPAYSGPLRWGIL